MAKTLNQLYYKVYDNGVVKTSNNIQDNFFERNLFQGVRVIKLSIQAPPGTVVNINNKAVIIGRSGLYDFDSNDEDIAITSLVFPRPQVYTRGDVDIDYKTALEGYLEDIKDQLSDLISPNPFDYKTFCEDGLKIMKGQKNANNSEYNYNYPTDNPTITLYGFSQVASEYLKTIQGTLEQTDSDLSNVIINYITVT